MSVITSHPSDHPPRLERPIDLYEAGELEGLILVWKNAENGWSDSRPARERTFPIERQPPFTNLSPGGRWLLLTTKGGAVTYYDLYAETIKGVALSEPGYIWWHLGVDGH